MVEDSAKLLVFLGLAESLSTDFGTLFQLFPYRWHYLALAAKPSPQHALLLSFTSGCSPILFQFRNNTDQMNRAARVRCILQ